MNNSEVFSKYKIIAVYGMSKNHFKPSYSVPMFMKKQGYTIIPINPTTEEIEGMKCYTSLSEIPETIDILNVFRPSEQCLAVVQEAVARKKTKGDISLIWLQEGIINDEARVLADANGIQFIQDKCMYKEFFNK